MFFIKECKRTLHAFWFHKSYKNDKSCKKKNLKERSVFYKVKKELNVLFQYIFIYLYIYILKKRTRIGHAFFCKRTVRSLRSFTFFAKECCILYALLCSLQKNVAFFAFLYVLKKRKQKNASFFWVSPKTRKKNVKERCVL